MRTIPESARLLCLVLALACLSGCATVRGWFGMNRSGVKQRMVVPRVAAGTPLRQVWPANRTEWSITDDSITATIGPMSGVVFIGAK